MMVRLTTHALDGTDGTHAGSVPVSLWRISAQGIRDLVFKMATDEGGRLSCEVDLTATNMSEKYELIFDTACYWSSCNKATTGANISPEIVLRFYMPDADAAYHMPVIISPNSYTVWWSN